MSAIVQVSFHRDRQRRAPEALLAAWPTLADAAIAAARAGADLAVVQAAHEDGLLVRDGVEFHFVRERIALRRQPPGSRIVRSAAPRLARRVRELAPVLLHVHGLGLPEHARRLKAAIPGVRLLVQDHADRLPRPWRRARARRGARSYDAVAFTAAEQAAPFFAAGIFPPGLPVHEVLEGSTHFSVGECAAARGALGVHGDPCLAWVGRLDANKDPLVVLEGLAPSLGRFADPHLWMCYRDAPLLPAVERRIRDDERLRGRVHLMGALAPARVELLLRAADVLLQGSWQEGSGYGVIEALACGATPIVTDIPSFRTIVAAAGRLWAPGNAAALTAALAWYARQDRGALRTRAVERFATALSWEALGRQLAGAYQTTIRAAAAPFAALESTGESRP